MPDSMHFVFKFTVGVIILRFCRSDSFHNIFSKLSLISGCFQGFVLDFRDEKGIDSCSWLTIEGVWPMLMRRQGHCVVIAIIQQNCIESLELRRLEATG